jgi:predicted Zn-dependent peptidase
MQSRPSLVLDPDLLATTAASERAEHGPVRRPGPASRRQRHARWRSAASVLAGLSFMLLFGVSAAPSALADGGIDDPAAALRVTTLDNGLTVLTVEDHTTPVASVQVWVKAGSRDESFYTGIAHLFEHMMFKGSKHLGPEEHAQLVGARGGRINAYTSRDVTVYFEDVTSESLPLVLDLEGERFAYLDISEKTLESEREVVLEERRMRIEDQPGGLAFEALAATLWRSHPYRHPVIGWRADVEEVTVEACRAFFDTYYAANNLVLVIVGDFETEETLAQVRRSFGGLSAAASIPRNPTRVVEPRGERRAIVHDDVSAPLLYAGWHAPPTGHADAEALDVASMILSAGRSSRLYQKLVYRDQIALQAAGGYMELQAAGLFYAVAVARPGADLSEVERAFFGELERVKQEGVSEDEVAKAKRQLEVSTLSGLDTTNALASRVGGEWVAFGRVRSIDERLAAIEAVEPADVQRVLQTYLVDEHRTVVHVVPPRAPAAQEAH